MEFVKHWIDHAEERLFAKYKLDQLLNGQTKLDLSIMLLPAPNACRRRPYGPVLLQRIWRTLRQREHCKYPLPDAFAPRLERLPDFGTVGASS